MTASALPDAPAEPDEAKGSELIEEKALVKVKNKAGKTAGLVADESLSCECRAPGQQGTDDRPISVRSVASVHNAQVTES